MISADSGADAAEADELRSAWATFLGRRSWDRFAPLTFKEPPRPEHIEELFRVWVSMLKRKLRSVRWPKPKEAAMSPSKLKESSRDQR